MPSLVYGGSVYGGSVYGGEKSRVCFAHVFRHLMCPRFADSADGYIGRNYIGHISIGRIYVIAVQVDFLMVATVYLDVRVVRHEQACGQT